MAESMKIAILGGTGHEGGGLARRWAKAGHIVVLGSRDPSKAADAAMAINQATSTGNVSGTTNVEAARQADIVVLTVPYAAQKSTVAEVSEVLAGKILIDATAPLMPPKVGTVQLPQTGSAVAAIQAMLGAEVRVVSAFQNVSAHHLADLDHAIDCDVLVCGDDEKARELVVGLANDAGCRGIHAGPIANSAAAEALTSLLIVINRRYKVPGAGIRITGV
jgi:NADPH-dependent F420 reductase